MGSATKRLDVVVYVYNSFKDPLFQNTIFHYILNESINSRFEFHLITFEQEEYFLNKQDKKRILKELSNKRIYWYPLMWHSGRAKLILKIWDFLTSLVLMVKLRIWYKTKAVISLGTVAGSFAFILSRPLGMKHYLYQYERHSEFLRDFGIWRSKSLSFKLLNFWERVAGKYSEWVATGTNYMIKRLQEEGFKGKLYLLPSCVDDTKFFYKEFARAEKRKLLDIEDRLTLIYIGKFGGIYFGLKEMAEFFKTWKTSFPSSFFVILSPQNPIEIVNEMKKAGMELQDLYVNNVDSSEIPDWLSMADLGLVAVPSYPSQKYRSPIKVGEYLCTGLPYIVGKDISEDDQVAKKFKVGVVLESYNKFGIEKSRIDIEKLLRENKKVQRDRCRKAGLEYRGLSKLIKTSEEIFENMYDTILK